MATEASADLTSSSGAGMALENYPDLRQRQYFELPCQPAFLDKGKAAPRGYDPRQEVLGALPVKGLSCRPLAANTAGSWKNKYVGPQKAAKDSIHLSTANAYANLQSGECYYAHFTDGTTDIGKFQYLA